MAEQIGYEFTVEDRRLLESLSRFSHGLDEVRADAKRMQVDTNKAFQQIISGMDQAQKKAGGFRNVLGGVLAADVIRRGVEGVKQLGTQAVRAAANYEQLQVAFSTFIGSTDRANKLLEQLSQTAASTPFQQDEIFQGARQLLAYGFASEEVNDQLLTLGNIASGVGQPLQRIVTVFGQITAKGKLTGEELRQLREAGVNPIKELAEVLNVAEHEIEGLITQGKISSQAVGQAFRIMTGEGGRFNDLMQKQSETFQGAASNFQDTVAIVLREFGTGLIPTLKEGLLAATSFLRSLKAEDIREFGRDVGKFVSILVPLVKQLAFAAAGFAAFKVVSSVIGLVRGLTGGVQALTLAIKANPFGFIAGTIVALLPQITTLISRLSGVTKVMEQMNGVLKEMRSNFIDEVQAVTDALNVFADFNSTQKERQKAYDTLNEKYPEILAKYDLEKGRLEDLIALQGDLKAAIVDRIREERLSESAKDFQKQLEEINKSRPSAFGVNNRVLGKGFTLGVDQADIDKFRKDQKDAALSEFKERNQLINQTAEELKDLSVEFAGLDTQVKGAQGRAFGQLKTQQELLNDSREREKVLAVELSKLSDQELRDAARNKTVDELRAKLATEILAKRQQEAAANQRSKKEIEDAAKALEKYRDALAKVAADIAGAQAENITDPIKKLNAEYQIALSANAQLFTELRKQAELTGQDTTEVAELETAARLAIERKFFLDLQELRKEKRESELADFLELARLQAELNNQTASKQIRSNGVNTSGELTRVALLQEDATRLQEELDRIIAVYGIFSAESLAAQAEYGQKVAELNDAIASNRVAALDREEQALIDEVDLIKRSGDSSLTLEEYKARKRLEIQQEFAELRLQALLAEGFGEDSIEVKQIRSVIAAYENALENLGKSDIFDRIKDQLAKVFNVDREVIDQTLQQLGSVFANISEMVTANTEFRIEEERRALEETRNLISEKEEQLRDEQQDARDGYAANIQAKEDELIALRNQEKKHRQEIAKLEKQQLKQKLASDALSQISSLITMVSNVVAAESSKGLLGVATGLTAITSFLLLFSTYKNQSKALAEKALFTGGRVPGEGYTDRAGGKGHRIEGTNMKVGRGEWVLNDRTSEVQDSFLSDLNAGKYDHLNLDKLLSSHKKTSVKLRPLSKDLARRVMEQDRKMIETQQRYNHSSRKEAIRDAFAPEVSRLIEYMKTQPHLIPWMPGQIGYIEKKGNNRRFRKFAE